MGLERAKLIGLLLHQKKVLIAFDVAVRASGNTSVAICKSHNRKILFIVAEYSRSYNPN